MLTGKSYFRLFLILSGVAVGGVFSYGIPSLLIPLLILPVVIPLTKSASSFSNKENLLNLTCFFLPYHVVVLSWFLDSYIGKIGISSSLALGLTTLSLCVIASVFTASMLPLVPFIKSSQSLFKNKPWILAVILPSAWVVCEWIRSVVFSLFLYGSGATAGDYWNFGSLGLGLIDSPIGDLSRIVGMYGLTFIAVLFSYFLWIVLSRKQLAPLICLIVVLGGLQVLSKGNNSLSANPDNNKTIQASVMQEQGYLSSKTQPPAVINNISNKKDLIVLPEYSEVFNHENETVGQTYVNNRLKADGASINVSDGKSTKRIGTLEFRDNKGKINDTQTKKLLIPTGEYMPYILYPILTSMGKSSVIHEFNQNRRLQVGDPPKIHKVTGQLVIGPVSCSGILGRSIYRNLTRSGATVLTNSASLLVFNDSKAYFHQSLDMARFHAIANNRAFIQASKGAPAFVLDGNGDFIVAPGNLSTSFKDFEFISNSKKTIYTILGEWVLFASAGVIIGVYLLRFTRTKLQK